MVMLMNANNPLILDPDTRGSLMAAESSCQEPKQESLSLVLQLDLCLPRNQIPNPESRRKDTPLECMYEPIGMSTPRKQVEKNT